MMRLSLVNSYGQAAQNALRLKLHSIMEANQAEEAKKGQMVALFVPEPIGRSIQDLFKDVPGDMVEPKYMHVTIGLVRSLDAQKVQDVVQDIADQMSPVYSRINGFGTFPGHAENDNKIVLWAKPQIEGIQDIHDEVFAQFKRHGLEIDNGDFPFKPHMTIKYCMKEPKLDGKRLNSKFKITKLSFAQGDRIYPFKFGGEAG